MKEFFKKTIVAGAFICALVIIYQFVEAQARREHAISVTRDAQVREKRSAELAAKIKQENARK